MHQLMVILEKQLIMFSDNQIEHNSKQNDLGIVLGLFHIIDYMTYPFIKRFGKNY